MSENSLGDSNLQTGNKLSYFDSMDYKAFIKQTSHLAITGFINGSFIKEVARTLFAPYEENKTDDIKKRLSAIYEATKVAPELLESGASQRSIVQLMLDGWKENSAICNSTISLINLRLNRNPKLSGIVLQAVSLKPV